MSTRGSNKALSKIKPINVRNFHSGMFVDSEIYIKINDTFVLLCVDITLNDSLIQKLKKAASSKYPIYVNIESYDNIIEQSKEFEKINSHDDYDTYTETIVEKDNYISELEQKLIKTENYKKVCLNTSSIFNKIENADTIDYDWYNEVDLATGNIYDEITQTETAIIIQCVNNIRQMDNYLYIHSTNVSMLNGLIGKWLGLSKVEINKLIKIGLLHDLGKLKVPQDILNKPARLTDEEFEIIKQHSLYSFYMLIDAGFVDKDILYAVRGHHERNNGLGYPDHLKGKNIPLYAKITAVSDVYDAMVAERPYKKSYSPFEILAEFSASRFSDLDKKVIDIFLGNIPKEFIGKKTRLSDGRAGVIVSINPNDFAYPIVKLDNEYIKTNKYLKCISVDDFINTFYSS